MPPLAAPAIEVLDRLVNPLMIRRYLAAGHAREHDMCLDIDHELEHRFPAPNPSARVSTR
jgi:hypothetical protein